MARVTAAEFAEKWKRRTQGATGDYQRGIERVTEAPGMKASARADAYASGVQRAVQEGRFQRGSESVSLEEWRRKAINKGVGRIAQGVEEAGTRVQSFAQELLAYEDQVVAGLPERGDVEQNINRSAEFQRKMHAFRGRGRGA